MSTTPIQPTGRSVIAGQPVAGDGEPFTATDPRTGEALQPAYTTVGFEQLDDAVTAAVEALSDPIDMAAIAEGLEAAADAFEAAADEVVATGAVLQAGIINKEVGGGVVLLDVTPLSLGIETKGGVMTTLIERNTTIPTRKSEIFTTAADSQPQVEIHVLQGEREMAQYNNTLGKFQLTGIPPAPRGVPQIEVAFDIDVNGIVHVSAIDKATGKEQSMTITGQSALPREDIDRMVRDAEQYAEEDRKAKEAAEIRNTADSLLFQTESLVKDNDDKIDATMKANLEQAQTDLRTALEGEDTEKVKDASDNLMRVSQEIGQALYAAGADQGAPSAGAPTEEDDDEIVDAEVVDEPDTDEDA